MPTIRTNGIETYYERRGEGRPIVFVHGAIMDRRMWAPQTDALADEFTTVAYDVRGHGRTGGSDVPTYTVDLYVEDLHALLAALDLDRPVLCGLSLGGCIAQAYAATYPETLSGLVLADTFTQAPLGLTGRLLFANLRVFAALDRVVRYKSLNRIQMAVGDLIKPGVAGEGGTVQELIDTGPTISHAEFVKIVDSLVAFPRGGDVELSRIDVPTLVLYGENEPSLMRDHAALMGELIPNAVSVTEIPDAGHASNIDNPAFFTEAVREFLDGPVQ
ncbi:alpha/beta fold hydrolase [Halorubrum sp. CSM-61]|uniref:alpha/beta fold hydrolase n=1 Tax=Halorubrum sp. CSM-61 TaxID=2485838 RepID=UPI000F4B4E3C|nr:alpha/beta hydrolase [Halorubrum sp. CSM-61]